MDLASLPKEKKQALILVGMWVIGGLLALYYFVLSPFFEKRSTSSKDLDVLAVQIEKAEVALQGESRLRAECEEAFEIFKHVDENDIIPMDNPLSWVTEKVYATARRVGVDIQAVAESGTPSGFWDTAIKSGRAVRPYGVRIVTECSYARLITLVNAMEESNPALCIVGISISAQEGNPANHVISLNVEWPMWGRKLQWGVVGTNQPPKDV